MITFKLQQYDGRWIACARMVVNGRTIGLVGFMKSEPKGYRLERLEADMRAELAAEVAA